jgi:prophage regulatory protein
MTYKDPTYPHLERLIRDTEVRHYTGLSKSAIKRSVADGEFPAPVKLGERSIAWRLSEVMHWIANRPTGGCQ